MTAAASRRSIEFRKTDRISEGVVDRVLVRVGWLSFPFFLVLFFFLGTTKKLSNAESGPWKSVHRCSADEKEKKKKKMIKR